MKNLKTGILKPLESTNMKPYSLLITELIVAGYIVKSLMV